MQDKILVRKASVKDVPEISEIVNNYAQKGIMLLRPISRIYDNVRDYHIIEINGEIIGCGALHVMWYDLAEIRALALKDDFIGKGYGSQLIEKLTEEARSLEVEKIFVLTYRQELFKKIGFYEISKSELPHKIWSECVNCIHFPDCDEVALMKVL